MTVDLRTTRPAPGAGLSTAVTHTVQLTGRPLRTLRRMPVFLVMTIVQPMIWLLLFGQLFKNIVDLPGFDSPPGGYISFMVPGVVMMTAMFGSSWAGTSYIQDMERGVMARLLTSPTSRTAMITSTIVYQSICTVIQAGIVLVVAALCGAQYPGGATGIVVLLVATVLLTAIFSALSNVVALLTRQQEALIGISQLLIMPLMFLSSAIMDTRLSPAWVRTVAKYNPFEWAVQVGREALSSTPDWDSVGIHLGLLAAATVVMIALATQAFRSYQRSV